MSEKEVLKETRPRMDTVIEDFRRKLATVRTGRAAVTLLDTVIVDYYGTMLPPVKPSIKICPPFGPIAGPAKA